MYSIMFIVLHLALVLLVGDIRVVGNKKGVLTRQREPKMAAYVLRDRYTGMFNTSQPKLTVLHNDDKLYFRPVF